VKFLPPIGALKQGEIDADLKSIKENLQKSSPTNLVSQNVAK
jgi:hypothetical protein